LERTDRIHWHRHVDWVAETFGDLVFAWVPVDEPTAFARAGYRLGRRPPGVTDAAQFAEALEATHLANHEAWRLLRGGEQPVAAIHDLRPFYADVHTDNPHERTAAEDRARRFDETMWCWTRARRDGVLQVPGRGPVERDDLAGAFDLIGFTYESAQTVFADGTGPYPGDARVGPLGNAPWPEGLGLVLRRLADELPGCPLVVGCGFATDDDEWRTSLLRDSLAQLELALDDGLDVRGWFHWTGVDTYEWDHGFDIPFGLFDRDRNARPSAEVARAWAQGRT
jgi:beta-glucosidase